MISIKLDDSKYLSYSLENFNSLLLEIIKELKSRDLNFNKARKQEIVTIEYMRNIILNHIRSKDEISNRFTKEELEKITEEMILEITAKGPLTEIYKKEGITDIHINSFDNIYYQKKNKMIKTDIQFRDAQHLQNYIDRILDEVGKKISAENLKVDAELADGSRIAVLHPLVTGGLSASIRFHSNKIFSLRSLIELKTIDEDIAKFLKFCVEYSINIMIYGETGTGKTSLIGALMTESYKANERFVLVTDIVENSFKKQYPDSNCLEIESRNSGSSIFTLEDAVKVALRHNPQKIYFNEMRDKAIFNYLDALNTGHSGASGMHSGDIEQWENRAISLIQQYNSKFEELYCKKVIADSIDVCIEMQTFKDKKIMAAIYAIEFKDNKIQYRKIAFYENETFNFNVEEITEKIVKKVRTKLRSQISKSEIIEIIGSEKI